jgi:hypothetical protein
VSSNGEWCSAGKLFARGWTIDDVLRAQRFLRTRHIPLGNGQQRLEILVEPDTDIRALAKAQEFFDAARNGDE